MMHHEGTKDTKPFHFEVVVGVPTCPIVSYVPSW